MLCIEIMNDLVKNVMHQIEEGIIDKKVYSHTVSRAKEQMMYLLDMHFLAADKGEACEVMDAPSWEWCPGEGMHGLSVYAG